MERPHAIQRLKGKTRIARLFEHGTSYKAGPLLLRFQQEDPYIVPSRMAGVSASKRNYPKAVDRIRTKRVLRAALHEQRDALNQIPGSWTLMLIYRGRGEIRFRESVMGLEKLVGLVRKDFG